MKRPVTPPRVQDLITSLPPERLVEVLTWRPGPAPGGKYRHWDTFRHLPTPKHLSADEAWLAIKMARQQLYQPLPLKDKSGQPFVYTLPAPALQMLHLVDRDASGTIQISEEVTNPHTRDTYLVKSLVEEAITSSQLEGASTTRQVAKDLIRLGREPRDRSERMIVNNYHAMRFLRQFQKADLTPSIVLELQKLLTEGTLDVPDGAGRLRGANETIQVSDEFGTVLHVPPHARELTARMQAMCDFANDLEREPFTHPVVRAITLHFWLGYDHPFVDGNGRTARALFYWSMARQGYWLSEFISISRILKKARGKYARSFLYTETDDNDLTYFLLYQLDVVLRAIKELHEYLARKARELRETEDVLRTNTHLRRQLNHRQLALLNHALKKPQSAYTVQSHRQSHDISYETARSDLLDLAERGLLVQGKRGRAFTYVPAPNLQAALAWAGGRGPMPSGQPARTSV